VNRSRAPWPWIGPALCCLLYVLAASPVAAQPVPRPFPRPGGSPRDTPPPPVPAGETEPLQSGATAPNTPDEATLGVSIYPNARYLAAYDAGRGQRYYLFGTNASFDDMVNYYGAVLRERGDRVFDSPPVHMFELGRFREETMAFPPSVTIKDYIWSGAAGYANPAPGGQPSHYATIIQIVPLLNPR
jgi:hypothetical protein